MKRKLSKILVIVPGLLLLIVSCSTSKKLAYINNLPVSEEGGYFTMTIPEYKVQTRDILYITVKAMTPDGKVTDFLMASGIYNSGSLTQSDAGGYIYGFEVNRDGNVIIPALGTQKVAGMSLEDIRRSLQSTADSVFKNSIVECKLLSYKFTVIGEVRSPGAYVNYNNYLTVLEAIGRAGGVGDYGNRSNVLIVRPTESGTRTYTVNLQDKALLESDAYFLLPNDVVIVQPMKSKIFNMNLPVISFILTSVTAAITTTLLLINYLNPSK